MSAMKWTDFFIPTSKDVPTEATVPSHQLMIRAGIIRQVVAGAYTYLPLGYRTLRRVEAIVREEMNAAGAIELHMPAMQPLEWWEQTGRAKAYGELLVRLGGKGDDWRSRTVLGPTHEEVITEIARSYIKSYKQLPINLYQIQTKFRGEARPKSGVLRTREFLMKDAYSFHASKEGVGGLDETYQRMYEAYCAIFARCGLPYLVVEAESGPIGGDASHEFMVPTDAGEDLLVRCESCKYAANVERAAFAPIPESSDSSPSTSFDEVHTPNLKTIDEVCEFLKRKPASMIKTLIYSGEIGEVREAPGTAHRAVAPGRDATARVEPVSNRLDQQTGSPAGSALAGHHYMVLVRGDHEVNESKLARVVGEPVELADERVIEAVTGARVGFAGPQGIGDKLGQSLRLIVDQAVSVMHNAASGANADDHHTIGIEPGTHFPLEGRFVTVADVRSVAEADRCPHCRGELVFEKCIEVGHVFKLGTKYSQVMGATFQGAESKLFPFIMGCYGIGLNRIMAAAVEAFHDDHGICWPMSIAPFQAVICALDMRESAVVSLAQTIHNELEAAGVDVLLDDRDARPGFKFKDADLIGFPIRVTVGKRGLAEGIVEVHTRRTGEVQKIPPEQCTHTVGDLVQTMLHDERTRAPGE